MPSHLSLSNKTVSSFRDNAFFVTVHSNIVLPKQYLRTFQDATLTDGASVAGVWLNMRLPHWSCSVITETNLLSAKQNGTGAMLQQDTRYVPTSAAECSSHRNTHELTLQSYVTALRDM
jgi:hypothetical protein